MTEADPAERTRAAWDTHYARDRSVQRYPDENLVRLLTKAGPLDPLLDYGCGSGRHLALARDLGVKDIHGVDVSTNSVAMCQELYPFAKTDVIHAEAGALPFEADYFQVLVAWGILHYIEEKRLPQVLSEFYRIMKPGAVFLTTLRSDRDTHLTTNADVANASKHFYSEQTARALLEPYFDDVSLGYMERTPVGELDRRIAHWIVRTTKT